MWIHTLYEFMLCWHESLFLGAITSFCLWSREGSKNAITLVQAMVMSVIIVLRVQTPTFGCCAWLAIMLFNMMIFVAPAAWARARTRARVQRRSRLTSFSGQTASARQRGLVIVHGLVALFLQVIALAIILHVVGHAVPCVLVVALTMIMALIVSMTIIRLAIVAITLVALMVTAIFVATMLLVAQFMATCCRNMSRTLFLWLLLVPGNLPRTPAALLVAWHCLKKAIILSGLAGTVLFKSANLFWCALGCAKKICSLFSCTKSTSIVQRR